MTADRALSILLGPCPPEALPYAHAERWVLNNMATDEAALRGVGEGWLPPLVRTYINPPSVVLGLSRRIAKDVDVAACAAREVVVTRRASGGGTVYHDRGTLNVSWILPWSWLPGCGPKSPLDNATAIFLDQVIAACREAGAPLPRRTRISDVSVGDPPRKVAGSGQLRKAHAILHHTSILIDLDLAAMIAVLPNPPDRPDIDHRDFVTSLESVADLRRPGWRLEPDGLPPEELPALRLTLALQEATLAYFGATIAPLLGDNEPGITALEAAREALILEKYRDPGWVGRL
ncbi:MAG: lipoate--protein ligase family protein [bacterium]